MGKVKNSAVRGVKFTAADSFKNQVGRRMFNWDETHDPVGRKIKRKRKKSSWHKDWKPKKGAIGFGL